MAELLPSSTVDRALISAQGKVVVLLAASVATDTSPAVQVNARSKVLQVSGITTATVHFEGSMDDVTYVSLGNVTANGKIANDEPWKYVRARVSAWTSGTIKAQLGY